MGVKSRIIFDKSSAIDHRTIGGEAFIITAEDSRIHSLNATASFIFDRCDGKTPVSAIVAAVVDAFDIDPVTAEQDVADFLADLHTRGVLVQR